MLRQQFPRGGEQAAMLLPYFAERAAQNLISRQAIIAEAQRVGLRVTDDEVRDELQHGRYSATFFPGGNFVGQQQYEAILQGADLSVPMFEQTIKRDILLDKFRNLITGSALVSDAAVQQEFQKQNVKVKFEYAVLRKDVALLCYLLDRVGPNDEKAGRTPLVVAYLAAEHGDLMARVKVRRAVHPLQCHGQLCRPGRRGIEMIGRNREIGGGGRHDRSEPVLGLAVPERREIDATVLALHR